jgi:hypothetical protein
MAHPLVLALKNDAKSVPPIFPCIKTGRGVTIEVVIEFPLKGVDL